MVSSSALPSHRYHTEPRALRTDEVEEIDRAPTAAARRSRPRPGSTGSRSPPRTATSPSSSSTPTGTGARPLRRGVALRAASRSRPCARRRPGSRSACASAPTRPPAQAVVAELAALVDYVHIAIGNSVDVRRLRRHRAAADRAAQRDRASSTGPFQRRQAADRDLARGRPGRRRPHDRRAASPTRSA